MLHDKEAVVLMEEGYMRIHIEYTNPESRTLICDKIGEVEMEMDVHPEVIHRRLGKEGGTFSVEFSGDTYICSRTSGEFIEKVLDRLHIEKCEYL
jgi:hypothetical protein